VEFALTVDHFVLPDECFVRCNTAMRRIDGWQSLKEVSLLKAPKGIVTLGRLEIIRYKALWKKYFQASIPKNRFSTTTRDTARRSPGRLSHFDCASSAATAILPPMYLNSSVNFAV